MITFEELEKRIRHELVAIDSLAAITQTSKEKRAEATGRKKALEIVPPLDVSARGLRLHSASNSTVFVEAEMSP